MVRRPELMLGVVHYASFPNAGTDSNLLVRSIKQLLEAPRRLSALEIGRVESLSLRSELRDLFSAHGTDVCYSALPTLLAKRLSLCSLTMPGRQNAIGEVIRHMDEAVEIGAQSVAILSGSDPGESSREYATDLLVDSLVTLLGEAEERHVDLSMELFDRDLDRRMLMGPSVEAAAVATRVRKHSPRFGLVVDLSHLPLQYETPDESLSVTAPYLSRVHVGNCVLRDRNHKFWGDTHPAFGVAGGENSTAEVLGFLSTCAAHGFFDRTRPVIIEVRPNQDDIAEAVLDSSVEVVTKAWSQLECHRTQVAGSEPKQS